MNAIAIIPARGGSKRIPHKNIKPFLGYPIIKYSIEAALKSGIFSEVMVSTDDPEIAEISQSYGAAVPFMRSEKNASDTATTFDVIEEVLIQYEKKGQKFQYGTCLYPTAPFANAARLQQFYAALLESDNDCVFPVVKYSYPIQRALTLGSKGQVSMLSPEHLITRSQDLSDTYHDAGQFYCFRSKALLKAKRLWTNQTAAIEVSELESQDIDNLSDWKLAELKYQLFTKKQI